MWEFPFCFVEDFIDFIHLQKFNNKNYFYEYKGEDLDMIHFRLFGFYLDLNCHLVLLIILPVFVLSQQFRDSDLYLKKIELSRYLISNSEPDSALKLLLQISKKDLPSIDAKSICEYYHLLSLTYQAKGSLDSTIKYSQLAKKYYDGGNLNDKQLLTEIYFTKGWLKNNTKDLDSADFYNRYSLNIANEIGYDSLKVLILKSLGNTNLSLRRYAEALNYYNHSLNIEVNRNNPSQLTIAGLIQNKGITFHLTGFIDSAKLYFRKSLEIKESLLSKGDPSLANGYINFSNFLRATGEPYAALEYINKAEALYKLSFGEEYFGLAALYFVKGSILIMIREFNEALEYHELAYDLYRKYYNPSDPIFADLDYNIGSIYESIGNFSESVRYHEDVLKNNPDPLREIRVLRSLGSCYSGLDEPQQADHYHQLAIQKAENFLGTKDEQTALCYHRYGEFKNLYGDYAVAIVYLSKALEIYRVIYGNESRDVSNVLTSLGLVYYNSRNYDKALYFYQQALISVTDNFKSDKYFENPPVDAIELDLNVVNTLYNKSFSLFGKYNLSKSLDDLMASLKTVELTIDLYEKIKLSFTGESTKLFLTNRINSIYNLAVNISSILYQKSGQEDYLDLCFMYSEKSKAAVLLSSLRETEALRVGNIPDQLRMSEKLVKNEMTQLKNLIYEEKQKAKPDSARISRLQVSLYNFKLTYDSIIQVLERNYQEYYDLKYNNEVIGLNQISKKLQPDEILIEYKMSDSLLYTFIIRQNYSRVSITLIDSTFLPKIEKFVHLMNTFPDVDNVSLHALEYARLGNELFSLLIPNDLPANQKLIIIPDDILGYLSFEALVMNYPRDKNITYRSLEYLIKAYTVSYGYSATLFFKKTKPERGQNHLLAMAPSYNANLPDDRFKDATLRDLSKYLKPLKYSLEEVANINSTFSGRLLTGIDATESNFKANASKYNILHFAMHTLVSDENPIASKLVFSLENDTLDDGFLNTYEIYDLNLNAKLAVLSACKTGIGKLSKGEGVMSLARGFLYAGVPGIVMTLWAIEDFSSAEIISGFYRNLKSGLTKDIALRQAKMEYLSSANQLQSHPYFWAAYVQIGDRSSVISLNRRLPYFISFAIVMIIAGMLIYRKRVRKISH